MCGCLSLLLSVTRDCQTLSPNLITSFEKRLVPYISYVEDVSFEWTHCNTSSTDSKVRNLIASEILELKRKSWVAVFLYDFSLPIFVDHELY